MSATATGGVLLLVEDDESIGRLVKAYLEQQDGWRVVWLRSGEEAVAELRRHPVRLVVLDIGLPGISGYDVARQVRSSSWGNHTRIVALTGWGNADDRVRSKEAGIDQHLVKPVQPGALMALLTELRDTSRGLERA